MSWSPRRWGHVAARTSAFVLAGQNFGLRRTAPLKFNKRPDGWFVNFFRCKILPRLGLPGKCLCYTSDMKKQTVRDLDVKNKRIFVRVDYNVPVKDGEVGDTLRIKASFETLNYLLEQGCSLVLASHLGEPKAGPDPKLSLKPVAAKASELLDKPIKFVADCVGSEVEAAVAALKPGELLLLENLRFNPGETANDDAFARQLAKLGEAYVDDAFAVAHRAHASVATTPKYLPAAAGFLLEHEVDTITAAVEDPKRPLIAVIGGAKISSKIEVLSNLLTKVDGLVIVGAMANTFLAAAGQPVGQSLFEKDQIETAKKIVNQAAAAKVKLILPADVVVTKKVEAGQPTRTIDPAAVAADDIIADLGPKTLAAAAGLIKTAGTVIWNGPVGVAEVPEFAAGTKALADAIIAAPAKSIIGGGDTAAYVDTAGLHDKFDLVSTGGGASLELMAGKPLPAVEALPDK